MIGYWFENRTIMVLATDTKLYLYYQAMISLWEKSDIARIRPLGECEGFMFTGRIEDMPFEPN